ncbi:MAG TPA: hypothetical protein VMU34_24790 [Mycobacterium sp.]|nr:hypothetical protein [Mycobacterium sp.]
MAIYVTVEPPGQNDFLFVPPGGSHAWHSESDEPASMPVLFEDERREWFARHSRGWRYIR